MGKSFEQLFAEIQAKKKAQLAAAPVPPVPFVPPVPVVERRILDTGQLTMAPLMPAAWANALEHQIQAALPMPGAIQLDEHQLRFIELASTHNVPNEPIILIGAAGTGKTTTVGKLIERIFETEPLHPVSWAHKYLPMKSAGIVVCSFTRRATANIRKRLPQDLQGNCITIHKLLEFEPDYIEVWDQKLGMMKSTMRFLPKRNQYNKLEYGLKYLIVEEYSMLGTQLWSQLKAALPEGVRIIFVGDIYQLPPVMDTPAVAPYLCVSPTVELQTVYRTALDNPIIKYATDIRNGRGFSVPDTLILKAPDGIGSLTLKPWKASAAEEIVIAQLGKFFRAEYLSGAYDPDDAQILIPWNKRLGSIELNKWIATAIAQKNQRPVYEVIAGFEKQYFAIGDRCIWDKNDCEILEIKRNPAFLGNVPQDESLFLDYWGHLNGVPRPAHESAIDEVEFLLGNAIASDVEDGERVKQASHRILIRLTDTGEEITLKSAGDVNLLDLSYAMTIHKAQGSEWRKVYLCFHKIHATTLNRELLYTGFTRAKEELYVICEKDTFVKGVKQQAIKGVTLEQKAETLRLKAKLAAKGIR